MEQTLIDAGMSVAKLIAGQTAEGQHGAHPGGVREMAADKRYDSKDAAAALAELRVRTYIAGPERGHGTGEAERRRGKWYTPTGVASAAKTAKRIERRRGEKMERNFAPQFDAGGMERLSVCGRGNVHKKLLLQAAACNLAPHARSLRSRQAQSRP